MFPLVREFAKLLVIAGGLLIIVGMLFLFGENIPYLGDLPGDIHFKYGNFRVFLPLGSAIVLSLGGTLLLNLILRILDR